MSTQYMWVTAVALAMDAFAVSISSGMCVKDLRLRHALQFGLYFGIFQLLMPVIGFLAGNAFSEYIKAVDHWIAFGLLSFIGGKMIYETFQEKEECVVPAAVMNPKNMLMMAIATSIDAMAVGVSFAFLGISIIMPALIIGLTAFVLSFCGAILGRKIGGLFQKSAGRFGGIMLIFIGFHILFEHLEMHFFLF